MLERAVRAARIELPVAERERARVAQHELNPPEPVTLSLPRDSEQRCAAVESDDTTSGTDDVGHALEFRSRPAPYVQHASAPGEAE